MPRFPALATSLLLIGVLVSVTTGCSTDAQADSGFVSGDGSVVVLDVQARNPSPNIGGLDFDGNAIQLSDYSGDVVVLNVWASWCAPCRAEAPALEEVAIQFAEQGVQFIGLNTRNSTTAAQAFTKKFGVSFPSIIDTDGKLQLQFNGTLPPQAIPSTIVIDKNGKVAARALGIVSAPTLRAMIEPLLDE